MTPRKLKILATHSFRTSGKIFREQMQRAGLDATIADLAEIFYVDAPHPASGPIPDDVAPFFQGPYLEWWNATREDDAWVYSGWEKSLAHIEDVCRLHGPFDGVMGFSQGGGMASLLVGMQRVGLLLQDQPPLRFMIIFAGIRVRSNVRGEQGQVCDVQQVYDAMADVPSLHVIGDRDPIKRMTNDLINNFRCPLVINHPKGHVVPALKGPDLQRFRAFLESQRQESSL